MKLAEYLENDLILPKLNANTKEEVLAELVAPIIAKYPELDSAMLKEVLLEREQLGTTGIGDGIAIPHGKIDGIDSILLVVGRSLEGIDFDALDYKPCHIFFLVLAPEHVAGTHLRVLAQISKLLKDQEFRRAFLAAETQNDLRELLNLA